MPSGLDVHFFSLPVPGRLDEKKRAKEKSRQKNASPHKANPLPAFLSGPPLGVLILRINPQISPHFHAHKPLMNLIPIKPGFDFLIF